MVLIALMVLFVILKYFEISFFANLSWWWLAALMLVAFVWFEFIEKWLGLDKKKAHESLEKARQDRVKNTFEDNKKKR